MITAPSNITGLLKRWQAGDVDAEEELLLAIYPALRAIAIRRISGDPANPSLQPTELVHEAYLRLVDQGQSNWKSREQFFSIAARVMRRLLVDHFRKKVSSKRGAGAFALPLELAADVAASSAREWLDLEAALRGLEEVDQRAGRVVELRYFAGLSVEETAAVLGVTGRTVLRDWRFARAFLQHELRG